MLKGFVVCALVLIQDTCFIHAQHQNCKASDQYPWSYHGRKNGPNVWKFIYLDCGKDFQSPVQIKPHYAFPSNKPPMSFDNLVKPITKATVSNEGWTVMVTPEDGESRYLTWKNKTYFLDGIHFHFGPEKDPGAVHVIDDTRHEMEIHFVAHKEDNEKNESKNVVLARLLELDQDNDALNPIADLVPNIKYRNDSTKLQSEFDIAGLLPPNRAPFYYYVGSNEVPPCEPESITWVILKDIGSVGNDQLDKFLVSYEVGEEDAIDGCLIGPNFRPEQEVGRARRVFKTK